MRSRGLFVPLLRISFAEARRPPVELDAAVRTQAEHSVWAEELGGRVGRALGARVTRLRSAAQLALAVRRRRGRRHAGLVAVATAAAAAAAHPSYAAYSAAAAAAAATAAAAVGALYRRLGAAHLRRRGDGRRQRRVRRRSGRRRGDGRRSRLVAFGQFALEGVQLLHEVEIRADVGLARAHQRERVVQAHRAARHQVGDGNGNGSGDAGQAMHQNADFLRSSFLCNQRSKKKYRFNNDEHV